MPFPPAPVGRGEELVLDVIKKGTVGRVSVPGRLSAPHYFYIHERPTDPSSSVIGFSVIGAFRQIRSPFLQHDA